MNARDRRRARRDNKRRRKAAAKSKPVERRLLPLDRPAPSFARLLQGTWSQASTPYGTEAGRSLLGALLPKGLEP